jgi:excisionase family DNA binding protein
VRKHSRDAGHVVFLPWGRREKSPGPFPFPFAILTPFVYTGVDMKKVDVEAAEVLSEPTYTVKEAAEMLRMNKFSVYRLIGAGALRAYKCGRRVLIPASAILERVEVREKTREMRWQRKKKEQA